MSTPINPAPPVTKRTASPYKQPKHQNTKTPKHFDMDKLRNIPAETRIYHPVHGEVLNMGIVTKSGSSNDPALPHRWVLWTDVDEEGDYKEIVETNGDLRVLPMGVFVIVWLRGSHYCHQSNSWNFEPHIAKVTGIEPRYHDIHCSLEVYRGDCVSEATFNRKVDGICFGDVQAMTGNFIECAA